MKPHLTLLVGLFFLASVPYANAAGDNTVWQTDGVEDGIEIFHRPIPGSDVIAMKGKGVIEAPLWKVAAVLLDVAHSPDWVDSLVDARAVRHLGPNRYIEYNHIATPFFLKDREFVSEVSIAVGLKEHTFSLEYRPSDDSLVPPSNHVRGQILAGRFVVRTLEPGKSVELVGELHCDPMGAIPKWLVNVFQRDWPLNTFRGIRTQVKKPEIAIEDGFKEVLDQTKGL